MNELFKNHGLIILKMFVLLLVIAVPYAIGEIQYRESLGQQTGIVVAIWEDESCYKGRNCHYTDLAVVAFPKNREFVTVGAGTFKVGDSYHQNKNYEFFPRPVTTSLGLYRVGFNFLVIIFPIALLFISLLYWMMNPKVKNPFGWMSEFSEFWRTLK